MKTLYILGAGGHGKVCLEVAITMNQWKNIIFLDSNPSFEGFYGYPVKLLENFKFETNNADYFVAIGDNQLRKSFLIKLEKLGLNIVTLIHNKASVSRFSTINKGAVVMSNTTINANARIGLGVIVNSNATVEHDCIINDYCHLSPGAIICGNVNIGENTWIGAGSVVINNIDIVYNCIIGANSTVTENVEVPGVYVGTPVKIIRGEYEK